MEDKEKEVSEYIKLALFSSKMSRALYFIFPV